MRERREHAFHQLAGRRVVNRLGGGAERDPERLQQRSKREVVVLVARKTRQVEHDHEVHAALVLAAVREHPLEFAAVGGLGAFSFFVEALDHLVALAPAVLFTRAQLRRQTEILGLLFRTHPYVDHRADHGWQLRPIREHRQGAASRHGDLARSAPLTEELVDDDVRHRFSVLANQRDLTISQRLCVSAEQLSAAGDRDPVRPVFPTINDVHGTPPLGVPSRYVWGGDRALQRARAEAWRAVSVERGCGP
ncbi:MAG TPA: hypothetical protein PLH72_18220 [Vicinamibacterales bacterium]|nr:hypothetical protein [Vicinamibacterales bacterium]